MFSDWRVQVALRLFGTTSGNRLMSFVGFLSVSGLTLAVAVLVTVLSVVNGFEKELRERVLGVLPHGTLYARDGIVDFSEVREQVLTHPAVTGAAPLVEGSGLIVSAGELHGVQIRGIDPALEAEVSILPAFMQEGAIEGLSDKPFGTVIGAELASRLDIRVGEKLTLVLPDVTFSLAGPVLTTKRLTVVGIFRVGADLDKNQMLLHFTDALKLKRQSRVDGLVVKTDDLFEAPRILHELSLAIDERDLIAVSWMRQNGNLYEAIKTQKATMFLLLLILVAVAAFNVVSNLVMTVDDNRAEIAILKTMGASPGDLRMIFVWHGMIVCLTGLLLGIVVGISLTQSLSFLFVTINDALGLNLMSEYFIRYLPTDVQWLDLVVISGVSLVICLFATIYPASKAAQSNPVEELSHEF